MARGVTWKMGGFQSRLADMETTAERDNLRYTKIPLTNGSGVIPALGFGTLIPTWSNPCKKNKYVKP
jgi:hypothetical protein